MAKIIWDNVGERLYETGTKNGVLYPQTNGAYPMGYAWNGLTAVTESPSGAEANPLYADDIKYLNLFSVEEFGGTIEAYTYPDEFAACDGSANLNGISGVIVGQQTRKAFGFCYRTVLGNDESNNDYGYKLHLVYGAKASPSERSYATINDSPDAITFSWEFTTTPVEVPGGKHSACITIDSTKVDPVKLKTLEDILYGTANSNPRLPLPAEVATIMGSTVTVYPLNTYFNGSLNVYDEYNDVTIDVTNPPRTINTEDGLEWSVTAETGYTLANLVVISDGVDVTSTAVSTEGTTKRITLEAAALTGAVTIMASANANA